MLHRMRGAERTGRGAPGKVREKPSASVANVQKAEMEMTPCGWKPKRYDLSGSKSAVLTSVIGQYCAHFLQLGSLRGAPGPSSVDLRV